VPLAKAVAMILHRPMITYGAAASEEEGGAMAILPTHNLSELDYVCLLSLREIKQISYTLILIYEINISSYANQSCCISERPKL
jgi:hypothetical protein